MTLEAPELRHRIYQSEKALLPDGSPKWVVVDHLYDLHAEATAYLASLRARDCSINTERNYAGRVALYLTHCSANGIDWTNPSFLQLAAYLRWLVDTPLPPKGHRPLPEPKFRSEGTANAIIGTTCEYLRFCCLHGWVPESVVAQLSQPKHLHYAPPGYDPGEDGQYRTIQARTIKFRIVVEGYEWLTEEQVSTLISLARHARDRFLISLMAATGARIGEILGLRREDLHLLPDSSSLGCKAKWPHVHIRRRQNANGALAKARRPRIIPVEADTAALYADYQYERDQVPEAVNCDMVFVNLFRAPLGLPMKYGTVKELFDRLAKLAGFTARPHMVRHFTISEWVRRGVRRDVCQELAGHVSPQSMDPYVHPTDQEKRDAVIKGASYRKDHA